MPTAPCQTGRGRLYAQRSMEISYIDTQRFPLLPPGKRSRRKEPSRYGAGQKEMPLEEFLSAKCHSEPVTDVTGVRISRMKSTTYQPTPKTLPISTQYTPYTGELRDSARFICLQDQTFV